VYDPKRNFANLVNHAQVDLVPLGTEPDLEEGMGRPQQRARSVHDFGMGDMLRHDAERLRILVERHQLHTGSALASELLADWGNAIRRFVKVMPRDYQRALEALAAERREAESVAAE
jgi:glutamate synthase (NADPH/NADH) large chain